MQFITTIGGHQNQELFFLYGFFYCTESEVPEIKNDLIIRFHRLVSLSDLI